VDIPLDLDRRAARRGLPSPRWEPTEETPEPAPVWAARPGPARVPLDWEMAPPADAGSGPAASGPLPDGRWPRPKLPPAAPVEFDLDADLEADARAEADAGLDAEVDDDLDDEAKAGSDADLDAHVEVDAIEVHRRRAPAWRRVTSWVVDGALLGALISVLLVPVLGGTGIGTGPDGVVEDLIRARGILVPVLLVVALVAFTYQWLGVALMGATPGMRVTGLRVVGADGDRPSPGQSAGRSLLALPAAAALGSGLLLALFTRSGRGAHDLGAGTWVVVADDGGGAP
jgi:uncharacterized RDD family membrane protein YckC